MLAAFKAHGPLVGWKFLRRSNCAFIDFESPAGAASARTALHGAELGGCVIRSTWHCLDTLLLHHLTCKGRYRTCQHAALCAVLMQCAADF